MFNAIRQRTVARLFKVIRRLEEKERSRRLGRNRVSILVFFHGFDRVSAHRALVVGRTLRHRGYSVDFAGTGSFADQIRQADFPLHDLDTPIQDLGAVPNFGANEEESDSSILQSVEAERALVGRLKPDLAIVDSRPTLRLTAALEGIDVVWITSAYNTPEYSYPIHSPEFVRTWDDIIESTAHQGWTCGTTFREMYLLCDIPAVHPSGQEMPANYSFVGPLLEGLDVEDQGDVERKGVYWDLSTLGADWSSIQEAVQKLGMKGIRQWVVPPVGVRIESMENCEMVDPNFLPQAASQAVVFAGGGDHGFFYQALFRGIPVIGLPTNCTQEYFTDRLQTMGLGIKLSYRDFTRPTALVQSVEGLLNHYAIFTRRCRTFAADIREWQDADRVADIIDGYWMSRSEESRIDPYYQVAQRDFARQLSLSTVLSEEHVEEMLENGRKHQMPHEMKRDGIWYDRSDSWNWLYDNDAGFFACDYEAREEMRSFFINRKNGVLRPAMESQRLRLTYTFTLSAVEDTTHNVRIFLPYPIATDFQKNIKLLSCSPVEMQGHFLPRSGFFYGYPIVCDFTSGEAYTFSYVCELTVYSRVMGDTTGTTETITPEQFESYTTVDESLVEHPLVCSCWEDIGIDEGSSDLEKARLLYYYLAKNKHFKKTKDSCQCYRCSTLKALTDDGGHCITLARAFIALCRLLKIPAREQAGAIAVNPIGPSRYENRTYNEVVFGHTWAEIFISGLGWIPVEFHGIAIGSPALTEANVQNEALRHKILENSDPYFDFFFGHLDCFHIVCSNSAAKEVPQVVVYEEADNNSPLIHRPDSLREECRLVFECL